MFRPWRDSRDLPSISSSPLRRVVAVVALALGLGAFGADPSRAFCGFYVAKAESELYNRASKVVIVRDGDRTVLTMSNDYEGDPTEFVMVIPVPTVLEREQIHVGDRAVIDHLDAYTAPRLVEYFDADPCLRRKRSLADGVAALRAAPEVAERSRRAESLGVSIEAAYTVGEYDIVLLSARESRGLETWLREEGYRLPEGAAPVLGSYLKQGMRFFVAKVNLEAKSRLGTAELRPLQIAFESPKFMLPVRLGTVNADGPQELFVWILNRTGRVETTNYRTVRLPTDVEIPEIVERDFGGFYRDLFARQAAKEKRRAVFLEYAWDMAWCDPCAADPLSRDQLRRLGVFWLDEPSPGRPFKPQSPAQDVFVTRLHMSYTAASFPEDLVFQETGDRGNFQGRYIVRRPFSGDAGRCSEGEDYLRGLAQRREAEAQRLASLTGRDLGEIRREMGLDAPPPAPTPWWKRLWRDG
ncbi:MAG: DUF2330 domain-containing protein [Acidobacteriota bacterium]